MQTRRPVARLFCIATDKAALVPRTRSTVVFMRLAGSWRAVAGALNGYYQKIMNDHR
jgi:hypothetical protein